MVIKYKLAVIPGDGIGKEVTPVALDVLKAVSSGKIEFEKVHFSLGAEQLKATGEVLNDETLAEIKKCDAILLGAVGDPSIPSGVLERGLLLKLRFELDHFVNLRPSSIREGVTSPLSDEVLAKGAVDFVVVREGIEGLYCGQGGSLREGTEFEVATEVSVNTAYGIERTVRYAYELAQKRRGKLTLVHKHNVLVHAGGLWNRIVTEVGAEYPEVELDYLHIDAATIFMVTNPQRFDVVVTDNLFGDILTDEAGAVCGGIGLAASGSIDASRKNPSMFEPVHGSAPDIAGQNLADPRAAVLSAALLFEHLGHDELGFGIRTAISKDIGEYSTVRGRSTAQIGANILAALQNA
ncbi:MAG: 3-isopropylmalate dehydrogenase [Candidatus Ancillula trichonymphae]|jgi:3-isopropylmalate dehydrogenase|nr:3-isopropylmalate dehydrogenase [Candidatus Ancillula trichonymphae]